MPPARKATEYERDYWDVLPEARALEAAVLVQPRTDSETASAAIFVKLSAIAELRPRAVQLIEFGVHDFDQLAARTRALCFAESACQMALSRRALSPEQVRTLFNAQTMLRAECSVLSLRGCPHVPRLEALSISRGHRHTASNVRHIVFDLRANWGAIEPHTRFRVEELDAIERLAEEVHSSCVPREQREAQRRHAADVRLRMFTLVLRSLHQVKRAAHYLCGASADKYVPAIYPGHERRKPKLPAPGPAG